MKGSNNNGGDWRKLIYLLAFGATILWLIEQQLIWEYMNSGTRLRESYEPQHKAKRKGSRTGIHYEGVVVSNTADEANTRTRFIRAQSVTRYLRANGINYASAGAYPSAVRMANKVGTRTSNGMKYRVPDQDPAADNTRMYLIWEGQTVDQVREAQAFAIMLHKVPFVVMCMGEGLKAPGEGQT